jgi:hypothetical protein
MKDDLDFEAIDQAVKEVARQQHPTKSVASPVHAAPRAASVAQKPTAKPSTKPTSKKPAKRPAAPDRPRGQYIDIIPAAPKPVPTVKIVATTETTTIIRNTPITSEPDDESEATFYEPVPPQPVTKPDDEDVAADLIEKLADEDFVKEPEPLSSAATAIHTPPYRPHQQFIQNLKVEKRPLSKDLPQDHDSRVESTKNTYSRASVIDRPDRRAKPAAPRKNKGATVAFVLILTAIIILGAAAGFLLYLLLAQ